MTRAADDAVRHAGEGNLVTVASGASPSGPIHLGNLREFITPHFVAEELRRRGVPVRHLHSWDDFDRFRKVPAGVPAEWADHIGRPLSAVPDPWECHASWAEHFKAPLQEALRDLGVEMEEISQTEMYTSGAYRDQVLLAVSRRDEIEAVLAKHRTRKVTPAEDASAQEAADLADSVANEDDEERPDARPATRSPASPTAPTAASAAATPSPPRRTTRRPRRCPTPAPRAASRAPPTCRPTPTASSSGRSTGRCAGPTRRSNFEPAGRDHMTPGSSYTVGTEIVSSIFDWRAPARVIYAFVGFAGVQKMSSSAGGVPTAADALRILEAPMLRWLYVRRAPTQAFDIDFGPSVVRLYDEWDALGRKAADPAKSDVATLAWHRASETAAGRLPTPAVPVPFRTLSSVADVTAGSAELISRIVESSGFPHDSVADLEPRLSKAMQWTVEHVPADERTTVRATPDAERLAALSEDEELWLRIFLDRLPDEPDLEAVTSVVYGVPKVARGLGFEDAPTDQVKADQKDFFRLLYQLLVAAERGPRLPTLVLALGPEKVRHLLGA